MFTRRKLMRSFGSTIALTASGGSLGSSGGANASGHRAAASGNPLATPEQLSAEALAIRLYRSQPVLKAMERGRRIMEADPRAKTTSGKSTVGLDLDEIAFHACSVTAIDWPSSWSHQCPETIVEPSGSVDDQVMETVCSRRLG